MMRKIWNNPTKYEEYFRFTGWYVSGDSAYQDEEGYFWFQGRVDDVINTSGERVGPFEVESKLVEHPAVAEAGVIGKPDPMRGEIIKAFISLREGYTPSDELKAEFPSLLKKGFLPMRLLVKLNLKTSCLKHAAAKLCAVFLKLGSSICQQATYRRLKTNKQTSLVCTRFHGLGRFFIAYIRFWK